MNNKNNIKIYYYDGLEKCYITYNKMNFSAGEIHITDLNTTESVQIQSVTVRATILSSEDFMELAMICQKLDKVFDKKHLILGYVPYSRQDRLTSYTEIFTLKVFTTMLNALKFDTVETWDNHSDVSTALIDNCYNVEQTEILKYQQLQKFNYIISPDAGANKKAFALSQLFNIEMIQADKKRDTTTGEITGTVVHAGENILMGESVLIADDICDGGRTVIEIVKILKDRGVKNVYVYFTHGIFSKGTDVLFDAGIDIIYTTDSFPKVDDDRVVYIKNIS